MGVLRLDPEQFSLQPRKLRLGVAGQRRDRHQARQTQARGRVRGRAQIVHQIGPVHRDAAARWRMLGLTTMLGANDAPGHTFTLGDATRVATFARTQHLGRLSLWSANRDAPCPAPTMAADDRCSGVDAPSWAFSRAYAGFPA